MAENVYKVRIKITGNYPLFILIEKVDIVDIVVFVDIVLFVDIVNKMELDMKGQVGD